MNRQPRVPARYHLLMTLLLVYLLLPLVLAAPLVALVPGLGLGGAYFEMLSCLTTTGATLFERPQLIAEPLHLWRSLVGWMGGLMVLVTAFAILAPLNLGGFEISRSGERLRGRPQRHDRGGEPRASCARRGQIAPIYAGFTGVARARCSSLPATGRSSPSATRWRRSRRAASPRSAASTAPSRDASGEIAIALFLLPAVSSRGLQHRMRRREFGPRLSDPQIQLMLISVLGITVVLFLRSFVGAAEIDRQDNLTAAMQAIWGSIFTVLSFLTTTGFESHDWRAMQLWSDLPEPGTILLGVAVMGGGIATTAGGVKLLRLYALYRHGLREMDRLIHPSSLGRRGQGDRLISERRRADRLHLPDAVPDRARPGDDGARGDRAQLRAQPRRSRSPGSTTTGPAIQHARRRARLRATCRRPARVDLLRRDDRRAHGGAGDHRALQPDLLAAVARPPRPRVPQSRRRPRKFAGAHWKWPNPPPILHCKNNKGRRVGGLIQLKAEKMAAETKQNLQDAFLNNVRKAKVPVTIFLMNGVKLQGVITWFDNFCVLLRRDGQSQLVYKHAISTVMPSQPITLYEAEDH